MTSTKASAIQLLDLAPEILNNIFELVVVNHHPVTGEKRPIHSRSYMMLTRRRLRGMLTCTRFYELMRPMYYGLNEFIFTEVSEAVEPPDFISIRKLDGLSKSSGLDLLRYGAFTHDRRLFSRAMLVPSSSARRLLKNVEIVISEVDDFDAQ